LHFSFFFSVSATASATTRLARREPLEEGGTEARGGGLEAAAWRRRPGGGGRASAWRARIGAVGSADVVVAFSIDPVK
jgi:hypothetical protein